MVDLPEDSFWLLIYIFYISFFFGAGVKGQLKMVRWLLGVKKTNAQLLLAFGRSSYVLIIFFLNFWQVTLGFRLME